MISFLFLEWGIEMHNRSSCAWMQAMFLVHHPGGHIGIRNTVCGAFQASEITAVEAKAGSI